MVRRMRRGLRRLLAAFLCIAVLEPVLFSQMLWAGEDKKPKKEESPGTRTLILGTCGAAPEALNAENVVQIEEDVYALVYATPGMAASSYQKFREWDGTAFVEMDEIIGLESAGAGKVPEEKMEVTEAALANPDVLTAEEKAHKEDPRTVTIAVVDTGIQGDAGNAGKYLLEEVDDENGHGTKIANLMADRFMQEGLTEKQIRLLPIRVTDESGTGSVMNLYLGIRAALKQGADLVNISLGTKNQTESELLNRIMEKAEQAGVPVITSAGNDGADVAGFSPAGIESVFTVGAIEKDKQLASFSNYGQMIDCVSYGTGIPVSGPGKRTHEDGTSYAAAIVTAELAVQMARGEVRSLEDAANYIRNSAEDLGEAGWDEKYGYGLVGSFPCAETKKERESEATESSKEQEREIEASKAPGAAAGYSREMVRKAELVNLLIGDILLLAGNENYDSTKLLAQTMRTSVDELFFNQADLSEAVSGSRTETEIVLKDYIESGNTAIDERGQALVSALKQSASNFEGHEKKRMEFLQMLDAFVLFLADYQKSAPLCAEVRTEAATTKSVGDAATLQSIAQTAGNYTVKLTKDIALTSEITVTNGCTLHIQSNKKKTRRTIQFAKLPEQYKYASGGGMCMFRVVGTNQNKLYLGTKSGEYPVTLDGNHQPHNGFLIYNSIWSGNTDSYRSATYLYPGTILKNNVMFYKGGDAVNGASGSAICNYGTLYMYGGTIQGSGFCGPSGVKVGEGGAVANYNKFYMSGGEIKNNTAANGNAILTKKLNDVPALGGFEMKITGGSIHDNGNEEEFTYTSSGGGILIDQNTPVSIGGSSSDAVMIYKNYADYGGGIVNHGNLTLGNCRIYGNYSASEGGGILNRARENSTAAPTLTIGGAYVYQNYCGKTNTNYAGGIASLKTTVGNQTIVPQLTITSGYFYDNDGYSIHIDSGTLSIGAGTRFGFSSYTSTSSYKVTETWSGSGICNTGGTVSIVGAARMFVPGGAIGIRNTGTLQFADGSGFLILCSNAECGIENTGKILCGQVIANTGGNDKYPYSIDGTAQYGIKNTESGTAYLVGRIRGNYTVTRTARMDGGVKGNIKFGVYNSSNQIYSAAEPYAVILDGGAAGSPALTGIINYAETGLYNTAAGSVLVKKQRISNGSGQGIHNRGTLTVSDPFAAVFGNGKAGIRNEAAGTLDLKNGLVYGNGTYGVRNLGICNLSGIKLGFSGYTSGSAYSTSQNDSGGIYNENTLRMISGSVVNGGNASAVVNEGTMNAEAGADIVLLSTGGEAVVKNGGKLASSHAAGKNPLWVIGNCKYGIRNTGSMKFNGRVDGHYQVTASGYAYNGYYRGFTEAAIYTSSAAEYDAGCPYALYLYGNGYAIGCAKDGIRADKGKICLSASSVTGNKNGIRVEKGAGAFLCDPNAQICANETGVVNSGTVWLTAADLHGNSVHGVYQDGTFYMSGAAKVRADNDVCLTEGHVITVNGPLNTDGVTARLTLADRGGAVFDKKTDEIGRVAVTAIYPGGKGSDALFDHAKESRFTLSNGGILRPGDYMDRETLAAEKRAQITGSDIVVSSRYEITYEKNIQKTDESGKPVDVVVADLPAGKVKYWCENLTISNEEPRVITEPYAFYCRFLHWSEDEKKGGNAIPLPMVYKENRSAVFYAQWRNEFNVAYIGLKQSAGLDFVQTGITDANPYTFFDNLDADETEHFTKTVRNSYRDDETGADVKQETTARVVSWGWKENRAQYDLAGEISTDSLLTQANAQNGITMGEPIADYHSDVPEMAEGQPFLNLYAIWDYGPMIRAYDLYYTLEEAQRTTDTQGITMEELLSSAMASDAEDGRLPQGVCISHANGGTTTFTVSNYKKEMFSSLVSEGTVEVNYRAIDTAGNITNQTVIVHVADTRPKELAMGRIRFISEKYLDTLAADSVWKAKSEYSAELKAALSNHKSGVESYQGQAFGETIQIEKAGSGTWNDAPEEILVFTGAQVKEAKAYIDANGIGNVKNKKGLDGFQKKFLNCK